MSGISGSYNAVTWLLDRNVEEGRGGKLAFTDSVSELTYRDLQKQSRRLANLLRRLGVRRQGDLRPMADDRSAMAELRNILVSREPLYARASAVVDTAGLSVDAAAARLGDAVAPVLQPEARMFARG